jgi:hypothetical protein
MTKLGGLENFHHDQSWKTMTPTACGVRHHVPLLLALLWQIYSRRCSLQIHFGNETARHGRQIATDLAEITAIDPAAAARAPDEMLGFVLRLLADRPPEIVPLGIIVSVAACGGVQAIRSLPRCAFRPR